MTRAAAPLPAAWAACLLLAAALPAAAQEAVHTDSAAVPSAGRVALRQSVRYLRAGGDPTPADREVEEWRSLTSVEYGLRPDLTLAAHLPLANREITYGSAEGDHHGGSHEGTGSFTDLGFDDASVSVKWRVYRNDFGPIDTARAAVVVGAELPTGADAFSGDSFDPYVGGVFSYVGGRHGFNADLRYLFTTGGMSDPVLAGEGSADALFANAAYLFRVAPADFATGSGAALYAVIEANGVYETNGDKELLLAPGLLFEAKNFAVEASVQLPAWQELDERLETELTVTFGVRFLF